MVNINNSLIFTEIIRNNDGMMMHLASKSACRKIVNNSDDMMRAFFIRLQRYIQKAPAGYLQGPFYD